MEEEEEEALTEVMAEAIEEAGREEAKDDDDDHDDDHDLAFGFYQGGRFIGVPLYKWFEVRQWLYFVQPFALNSVDPTQVAWPPDRLLIAS